MSPYQEVPAGMTSTPSQTRQLSELPTLHVQAPTFTRTSAEVVAAREQGWCARTEYGLAVLRYDAVQELIKDPRITKGLYKWPDLNGITSGPWRTFWRSVITNLEGADHDRLRKLINPALSPRVVEALAPRFRELADELIENFVDARRCEFVADFTTPYASRVVCLFLGLPEEDAPMVAGWAEQMAAGQSIRIKDELDRIEVALGELYDYVDRIIEGRRCAPRDDMISMLVAAEADGDRLSADELRTMCAGLMFAGFDTTRKQLGLGMQTFLDHPSQWQLLARRPEFADAAVNEVMRVNPVFSWISREAKVDLTYRGLEIPRGTVIHLYTEASGTDPWIQPDPSFDITATHRAKHFGFGAGLHHCGGHFLARRDMAVAFTRLSARLPNPRSDGDGEWMPWSGAAGPITLPITFDTPSGGFESLEET